MFKVHGVVVDENGQPKASAEVLVRWTGVHQRTAVEQPHENAATTNERGEFAIAGIDPRGKTRVIARSGAAFAVKALAGEPLDKPLRLQLSAQLALNGRVVDESGQPVAGATLEVWHRPWTASPVASPAKKLDLGKHPAPRTDAKGRFSVPAPEPEGEYRFTIRAAGMKTTESPWFAAGTFSPAKPVDLAVPRVSGVAGSVRDRNGKPLSDARIAVVTDKGRVETAADAAGQFKVSMVGNGPAFLFIRHPDCRFYGELMGATSERLDRTLIRLTEPSAKRLAVEALPERDVRTRLAGQLTDAVKRRLAEETNAERKQRLLQQLIPVAPDYVVEYVEKNPLKSRMIHDFALREVARTLRHRNPDRARELAELTRDPYARAFVYCDLCDAMPENDKDKRLELLAEALVQARSVQSPELRVACLGFVGERLLDLGEHKSATKVLREGEKLAEPFDGAIRRLCATALPRNWLRSTSPPPWP